MSSDFLTDRRRSVEEAFFAKQNEALRVQLRTGQGSETPAAALRDASGIGDAVVLDTLVRLDVGPEGAAVLALVPLVAVAWADGDLDWKEREALLTAAENAGLDPSGTSYALFETWLDHQPPASLLGQWKDFVRSLQPSMTGEARAAMTREILGKARAVAEAAGGFLGLGRVSNAEEAVLADLERTLAA
jgi:tellurite resistance protein